MADTTFEIDIQADASSADRAAAAVEALASQLDLAQSSAVAAANALKTAEGAYAIAESSVARTSAALERANIALSAGQGALAKALDVGDAAGISAAESKLAKLTRAQQNAEVKAREAGVALEYEAAALDRMRAASASATSVQDALKKKLDDQKESVVSLTEAQKRMEGTGDPKEALDGLSKLSPVLGDTATKAKDAIEGVEQLSASLGVAGAYALAAAAILAISVAAIAGAASLTKFAVGMADAARTSRLLADGVAGSVDGGAALNAKMDELAGTIPVTRDELMGMASELRKAGKTGDELSSSLEEAAIKAATLRLGPNFRDEMLSAERQTAKLKASLTKLVSGVKVDKLQRGFADLVGIFDEGTASGRAIKVVFESMVQPLIDGIATAIPSVTRLFLHLQIWALKGLILMKPYASIFVDVGKAALVGGAVIVAAGVGIVAAIGGIVAIGQVLSNWIVSAIAYVINLGASFVKLATDIIANPGMAIDFLKSKFVELQAWFSSINLTEIGINLMMGLANGITSGVAGVVSAVTGGVTSAIDSAKSLLGIASPSKVFAEIGGQTAEGMAQGVDDGAGGVSSALESMVAPPDAAGGAATASGAAGGHTFNITVNAGAGATPGAGESIAMAVRDAIESLLAGDAAQAGVAVPA